MKLGFLTEVRLSFYLARSEITSRYARSILGSFWMTVQQALYVGFAGLVFHKVFNVTPASYLPYFAISYLFWNFLSASILDSMEALPANASMIKDRGFAPEVFLFAAFIRNMLVSAHALPVPVALFLLYGGPSPAGVALALPGLISFLVAIAAVSYILGLFAVRYRDLKRLVESVLQIAFLVTPILWKPNFIAGHHVLIIYANPLSHLFDAWRQPLLAGELPLDSLALSLAISALCALAALVARREIGSIAIWI